MSGEAAEQEEADEAAAEAGAPRCLRGSPERKKDLMEQYQVAYVLSVASAAGCVLSDPRIDEGVDVSLTHRADVHLDDHVARLEIQLKATAHKLSADGSKISAPMKKKRYNYFRTVDPIVRKIVVIMHMPEAQDDWLELGPESLRVHHGAYWVNLDGAPEKDQNYITVSAPTTNKFTDVELCNMMERIGQGGKP